MKNKLLSLFLAASLLFATLSGVIPVTSLAKENVSEHIIEKSETPFRLYYDEEASHGVAEGYDDVDTSFGSGSTMIAAHPNDDWERWSIPIGNGYFGANLFGRTDTERIQLTEKTLANPYRINSDSSYPTDGLNNFSETYIDFGHENSGVSNYSRELDLNTAVSTVKYGYGGVTYSREYFTSYPDKAMVIRLDASSAGALSFVLRPTVPYEQEYMQKVGDRGGKTGTVTSSVSDGVGYVTLSGKLEYFDIDFVGLYKVYTNGGTVTATTCINADGDTDGTITVSGATSAYIVITMGTDYELTSETFTASTLSKPTFSTGIAEATAKVQGYMDSVDSVISGKSYEDAYALLKARHLADYQELFGRVSLDLNFNEADMALTTDVLLQNYKNGCGSTYLEALYFQYGRYLLIASSRKGALPANLQGTWNRYNHAPWSSGYWHNINVQMNYWPAFSTNLAETFEAYVDYNNAYMAKAEAGATSKVNAYNKDAVGQDGGNGWSIDTGGYVSDVNGSTSIGNLGFTTQLFWEYYEYTQDEHILREVVYPVLVGAARFITKMVKDDGNGNYIAVYTDSPEQYVNGAWYYTDQGTAYAQSFAYQNNYNMLLAAKELGIDFTDTTHEDYAIIQTVLEQIDKYDPVRVGLSGQVKEFFEEEYYGDLGEYNHRHVSQLVGLYPGSMINETTPAWLDAAEYSLIERGGGRSGWSSAHRLTLWARLLDGEKSHDMLEELLTVYTATNLWDIHPPFQIDGNFGGTAGISEMLLQSHAGYVEPLAAMPDAWANGSYTGLVARGNFEVSAAWSDGVATSFNITSLSGGELSVKYGGIENSTVADLDGNMVEYAVTDNNIITFDTEAGKTYVIWGFEKQVKPDKVENLQINSEFLSTSTLTWDASDDAVAYRVYVAKESDPAYTLLATTQSTSYVYVPEELENLRLTFAVTAVNARGVESKRALVYRNPDDASSPVEDVSASIVDDELQVAIKSNEYAGKYKLYSRKTSVSDWVLVQESVYPIIIDETYDSSLKYGVSVTSLYGQESEIVTISSYGTAPVKVDYNPSNILLGTTFVPTTPALKCVHSADYTYSKLTDGNFDSKLGRFSTTVNASSVFDATVSLPAGFILGELRIWDFNAYYSTANYVGTAMTIEIFYDGEWTTVVQCADNAEILSHRSSISGKGNYLSFDLSGYKAQMIRIYIPTPVSGNSISLYEIECSGVLIPAGKVHSDNLLLGKELYLSEYTTKYLNSASGNGTKLTDGILKTSNNADCFYTWYNQTNMEFDALVGFDGEVLLNTLRIYDYNGETNWANSVGPQIIVQAGLGDKWTTVQDITIVGGSGNSINNYRKSGNRPNSNGATTEYWIELDLGGIKADRLRIYMPARSSGHFGFYEIECDGYYTENSDVKYENNLFLGKEFIPTSAASSVLWGGNPYSNLTDGVADSSHRLATSGKASFVDATLSFGGYIASLDTLTIDYGAYTQARSGSGLVIQVFNNGVWNDALNITYTEALQGKVTYDLGHVKGSLVRIYVPSVYPTASGTLTAGDCIVIHEISCTGSLAPAAYDVELIDNLFTGKTFVAGDSSGNVWSGSYANMTDGSKSTRAAVNTSLDAVVDLGGLYTISVIDITYDAGNPKRCGSELQIQAYNNGEWTTAATIHHTSMVTTDSIDLGGVQAEKVRIYIPSVYSDSTITGDCMVIYEISCTGALLTAKDQKESTDDVFTGLEFLPTENAGAIWDGHGYSCLTDDGATNDGNSRLVTEQGAPVDGVLDFEGKIAELHTLTVNFDPYTATRCGSNFIVHVYYEGVWKQILNYTHTEPVNVKVFDLGGELAEKIRISVSGKYNNGGQTGDTIAIYEVSCNGYFIIPEESYEDKGSNILLGTTADKLTLENATVHPGTAVKDLTNAFDGDTTSTRYAVLDAAGAYSLVIDLGDDVPLYTLSIYDWRGESTTRSDKTTVEIYCDGCWVPVIVNQPLVTTAASTSFDLMGTVASKIRITFNNTTSNSRATIYEITCTTGSESAVDRSALLEAYESFADMDLGEQFAGNEMKQLKLDELKALLMNTTATQNDIDAYTETVNTAKSEAVIGMPTTQEYGDLTTHNLKLSDDIAFNFYGAFGDSVETLFPDAYVYVEYADGEAERYPLSVLEVADDGKLKVSLNLAAAEMTDTVKLRVIFNANACGEYIESSVRKYSDIILSDESQSDTTKALIIAMLDYGAYAQEYFGYNTENLANAGIHAEGVDPVADVTYDSSVKIVKHGAATGLASNGWSLALEEKVRVRFYFNADNVNNYSISYKTSDGSINYGILTPELMEDGSYRIEVEIEDASLLDNWYTISIVNHRDSTQLDLTFSVMCYVEKILSGSLGNNEKLVNLAKAIKLYSTKANEYVN